MLQNLTRTEIVKRLGHVFNIGFHGEDIVISNKFILLQTLTGTEIAHTSGHMFNIGFHKENIEIALSKSFDKEFGI